MLVKIVRTEAWNGLRLTRDTVLDLPESTVDELEKLHPPVAERIKGAVTIGERTVEVNMGGTPATTLLLQQGDD